MLSATPGNTHAHIGAAELSQRAYYTDAHRQKITDTPTPTRR